MKKNVIALLSLLAGAAALAQPSAEDTRYIHLKVEAIRDEPDAFRKCEAARLEWQKDNPAYKTVLWTRRTDRDPLTRFDTCEISYTGHDRNIAYMETGRIAWAQSFDAQNKCGRALEQWQKRHPEVRDARWTRQWVNIEPDARSACLIEYSTKAPDTVLYEFFVDKRTGSLREVCEPARREWKKANPQYRSVLWTGYGYIGGFGKFTCEFKYSTEATDTAWAVAAPISDNDDAVKKCEAAQRRWQQDNRDDAINVKWTGNWTVTIPGRMAACEITYSTAAD